MSIQENVLKIKRGVIFWIREHFYEIITPIIMLGGALLFFLGGVVWHMKQGTPPREIAFIPENRPTIPDLLYPQLPDTSPRVSPITSPSHATGTLSSTPVKKSSSLLPTGSFVASQKGKAYYPLSCKGWSRIKEGNRVYFTSSHEAESRGYTLARTCQKTSL